MYGHMATSLCLVCRMSSRRKHHAWQKLQMYAQGKSCKCMSIAFVRTNVLRTKAKDIHLHIHLQLGEARAKKGLRTYICNFCLRARNRRVQPENIPLQRMSSCTTRENIPLQRMYGVACGQPTCDAGGLLVDVVRLCAGTHYQDMRHTIAENNPTQKIANVMNYLSTSLDRCCLPLCLAYRMSSTPVACQLAISYL